MGGTGEGRAAVAGRPGGFDDGRVAIDGGPGGLDDGRVAIDGGLDDGRAAAGGIAPG